MNRPRLLGVALTALALLPGCEAAQNVTSGLLGPSIQAGQPGFVRGFIGGVAAEEPTAAAAAREVLSAGGNAADAAVAAGFAMAATLPSRVGLGGGGVCMVYGVRRNVAEAVIFTAGARTSVPSDADRPAAIPMLARGLFALHTRIAGGRPFEELMAPAEQLARFGAPMSQALANDLTAVQGPLFADPNARAIFSRDGRPFQVGERFLNPSLGATLTALRTAGVGDLYQGAMARRLEEASGLAGGGSIGIEELRQALPQVVAPVQVDGRPGDRLAFPPTPGGLAAAAAFRALQAGQPAEAAQARALAVGSAARQRGGDPNAILVAEDLPAAPGGAYPASAGLMVFDRQGNAVSCAFTLNNLFGTGRVAPGLGFLLAAAPGIGSVEPPLLGPAVVYAPNTRAFRAAAAGSGQQAAPMAVAAPLAQHILRGVGVTDSAGTAPNPGRTQLGGCSRYLPGWEQDCAAATDPRGNGVSLGATDR
jgi:gamma-glutamyltranspeptidase/glutathione hydrolase